MRSKANRLEIWRPQEGSLHLFHSKLVHGTISVLQKLRPRDSPTALLFVGTDRFEYFSLEWNHETNQLDTIDDFHDVGEKFLRDSQSQDRCMVDPSGRYMGLLLWEGVMSVLRLRTRKGLQKKLDWMEQVRLSELYIRAGTFIHSETGHPKIALLYQTRFDVPDASLAVYRLTSDDKDTTASKFDPTRDRELSMHIEDPGASILIPVEKVEDERRHNVRNVGGSAKAHLGGLVVVGETKMVYVDDLTRAVVEVALSTPNTFVAWARFDGTHFFLSDEYGGVHMLTLVVEGDVVTDLLVHPIGQASRASALVYLGKGLLFVASHTGDSQVYQLDLSEEASQYLHLVQTMPNIGPVLDFTIMDMGDRDDDKQLGGEYSSGQARIVTATGVYRDGGLRSVRSGVGLEDIGVLGDFPGVRGLFPIRSRGVQQHVDTLVVSFLTETRVFRFDPSGAIEEVDAFQGLSLGVGSLLVANVPDGRLLQVTPDLVLLVDAPSGRSVGTWAPPDGTTITNASANDKWVLLSIKGTLLISLNIENGLKRVEERVVPDDQVACLHVAPGLANVGVVGFWTSGSIAMLDLATLMPRHGESLRQKEDSSSIPRDIVLTQLVPPDIGGPSLFVAMDDGNVVSFAVSKTDLALSGRKSVVLGTQQARFHVLPRTDGTYSVFTATDHPSLIYSEEGRTVYAAVTAEDATFVCPFDAEAFPESVVVATDKSISISRIDAEQRAHTTSLPMGETIRRMAYSQSERVFGLGCLKRELRNGVEHITSTFRLVDEVVFDKVQQPIELQQGPPAEAVECVIRAELPDMHGSPVERFIVGTSFLDNQQEPVQDAKNGGRILVIGLDSERSPYIILSHNTKGACRTMAAMDGMLVVALTKTVVLYRFDQETSAAASLHKVASYRPSTYPVDLAVHGNLIAVADLMKSMSVVEFVPPRDGLDARLEERCRHYQSAWTTSICHIEGGSWLEADGQGNLLVLKQNAQGVTREDRRRMEVTSEMNLGEMVNKIRPVAVETSPNALVTPRAFLATVSDPRGPAVTDAS